MHLSQLSQPCSAPLARQARLAHPTGSPSPARWLRRLRTLILSSVLLPALGASLALGGLLGCGVPPSPPGFEEVLLQGEGSNKLLLIDINGFISNQPLLIPQIGVVPGMVARVRQELEIAHRDPDIRGVLLRIHSPGGTLTDSDTLHHLLTTFKRSKKVKIVAALGDVATSGGLYVAMAADEIYAQPTSIVGSVGVIVPHMEYSALLEKLGVRADPIKSGPYKDIQSPFRPRTETETRLLQSIVDAQLERFVAVIRQSRPQMNATQIERIADGRLLSADTARQEGLIDDVQYLDQSYQRLTQLSQLPQSRLVRYANVWATGNNIYSNTFPIEVVP